MKSAGLSSKFKKVIRHNTKTAAFANTQRIQMAERERVRTLRVQADRARFEKLEKMKKESELAEAALPEPTL